MRVLQIILSETKEHSEFKKFISHTCFQSDRQVQLVKSESKSKKPTLILFN